MASLAIQWRTVTAQPFMFVRYTTPLSALPARVGDGIGLAQAAISVQGLTAAGYPCARYLALRGESATVEIGVPVMAAGIRAGDVEAGELPAGIVAHAVHAGSYEGLGDSYRAIAQWAADRGVDFTGAPWEYYVVDPHSDPDPAAWRTEIFWPLQR